MGRRTDVASHDRTSGPAQAGRLLGGVCRKILRTACGSTRSRPQKGTGPRIARALLWTFRLIVIGLLLYTAFWVGIALVRVFAVAIVIARSSSGAESIEWDIDNHPDHRERLFYHPQDHNDDPDPRWP